MTSNVQLPQGITSDHVADVCRHAAIAFCRGASVGWSKRELVEWLVGPYDDASLTVRESLLPPVITAPTQRPAPSFDDDRIIQLVDPAWQEAVTCIEDFANGGESRHLDEALHRGSIVEAWIDEARSIFVPVNRPGLALGVRVRSLLVVDFLLRPEDYAGDIRVCGECGVVLLGLWARDRGHCEDHVRRSEVSPAFDESMAEGAEGDDTLADLVVPERLLINR